MALSSCKVEIDSSGQEMRIHGISAFPFACYADDLDRDGDVPWHWHKEFEAGIVTSGSVLCIIGTHQKTLKEGDGFFISSGAMHAMEVDHTETINRMHSIVFGKELFNNTIIETKYLSPLTEDSDFAGFFLDPKIKWQKDMLQEIHRAWKYETEEKELHELNTISETLSLMTNVLQYKDDQLSLHGENTRDNWRIKSMILYIERNYGEDISLTDICSAAAVSKTEGLRTFRRIVNTTPMQYLQNLRIRKAEELLTDTDTRITEIASVCGFRDLSYFTKTFRAKTGMTPSEYRKSMSQ